MTILVQNGLGARLLAHPVFASLADADGSVLLLLQSSARRHLLPPRTLVFSEGDPGEALYLIERGQVRIFVSADRGAELTVDFLAAGDVFGELGTLTGRPRSASIITMTDTSVLAWHRDTVMHCIQAHQEIGVRLAEVVGCRLRESNEHALRLAMFGPRERIAHALAHLADRRGEPVPNGMRIGYLLTQGDLASLTGTSRETVNRVLTELRDEGAICYSSRDFVIRDRDLLVGNA